MTTFSTTVLNKDSRGRVYAVVDDTGKECGRFEYLERAGLVAEIANGINSTNRNYILSSTLYYSYADTNATIYDRVYQEIGIVTFNENEGQWELTFSNDVLGWGKQTSSSRKAIELFALAYVEDLIAGGY